MISAWPPEAAEKRTSWHFGVMAQSGLFKKPQRLLALRKKTQRSLAVLCEETAKYTIEEQRPWSDGRYSISLAAEAKIMRADFA